jgi:linoleoyl-CoA desaturase
MKDKIVFARPRDDSFTLEVREKASAYFRTRGISDKANSMMICKGVCMVALLFVPYGFILSYEFDPLLSLSLTFVMGIGYAGIGFCIAHDALHGAYSRSTWVNLVLGLFFEVIGASRYIWALTHMRIHHIYTNVLSVDEDITVTNPFVRLSPGSLRCWYHRYQHFYAWILYALATLNWVFIKDYRYLMAGKLGLDEDPKHPPSKIVEVLVFKALHYAWTLIIPLAVIDLPWWQVAIGYLTMHLTAGTILGVIFQLAHVVEPVAFVSGNGQGRIDEEWCVYQMRTTANFANGDRLLSWYLGGTNFQIEHHLFPQVCSVHYPTLRPIVEEAAQRHAIPYYSFDTLHDAITSHYRMLRHLGLPSCHEQVVSH